MKCPVDGATLVISERSNIEIDHCPTCRGVWLDRGELDKIIERSEERQQPSRSSEPSRSYSDRNDNSEQRHTSDYHGDGNKHHQKKKRESFIGDLFDF